MPSSVGACATGPRMKRVGFGLGLRPFAGNAPNLDFEKIRKKSHPFFRLRRRLATAQGHCCVLVWDVSFLGCGSINPRRASDLDCRNSRLALCSVFPFVPTPSCLHSASCSFDTPNSAPSLSRGPSQASSAAPPPLLAAFPPAPDLRVRFQPHHAG